MQIRILLAACALFSVPSAAFAQQSPGFELRRISVIAAGASVLSTSYECAATVGEQSPTGGASFCNVGYVAGFGFWSVLGDPAVPIRLVAARSPGDSSAVDLTWTGVADVFEIYRSSAPDDVIDPSHLIAVTRECAFTDALAGAADRYFYEVLARPD